MSDVKKIDKLTKEQEAQIPVYLERYRKIGLSTEPTDFKAAETAITDSYLYQKMKAPEYIIAQDPFEGARLAAQHAKGDVNVTDEEVREQATKASYGSFNAQWVVFYAYIAEVLPVKADNLIEIVQRIIKDAGVYWTFEDLVIVSPKPTEIHMVDGKLHRTDGPALLYGTGRGVYAINGVRKNSLMEVAMQAHYKEHSEKDGKKTGKGSKAKTA